MSLINWKEILQKEIFPGYLAQIHTSDNMTFTRVQIKAGSPLPVHHHVQEQVSVMIKGTYKMIIEDEEIVLREGDTCFIKSNAEHSGIALEDCIIMDFFSPRRDDFIPKTI